MKDDRIDIVTVVPLTETSTLILLQSLPLRMNSGTDEGEYKAW